MAMPAKPQRPEKDCWGGFNSHLGYCEKKPRAGCLTCWWHRSQERAAVKLRDKLAEAEQLKTTCFHCSDPAVPATFGESPRCERHKDV
jgi:hypothetical protein